MRPHFDGAKVFGGEQNRISFGGTVEFSMIYEMTGRLRGKSQITEGDE